jgi:putative DNA primase/helicase
MTPVNVAAAIPTVDDAFTGATFCDLHGTENCEHPGCLPAEDPSVEGTRPLRTFTMGTLAAHQFTHRRPLLCRHGMPILCEGHLAENYAARGTGKSWFSMTLGLAAASGTDALGFSAPTPCRVLNVDGEMASEELQARVAALATALNILETDNFVMLAADWQDDYLPRLDTRAGQEAIEPYVAAADLIILDNRSCLFDPEGEKDPTAWQPAQDWLLSLRRRGKAVVINHHSNRQGGARGHSKPEDVMNLLIKLTRPEDYHADQGARFRVEFDKARGAYGAAVAPFTTQFTAGGWLMDATEPGTNDTARKLREHVRLADKAGERVTSANAAINRARVNRNAGLEAWATLLKTGSIQRHQDGGFYVP